MAEGLAADAVNGLRERLLERWPPGTELRWTSDPDDEGVVRHALLLDARGRLLATGEDFTMPAVFRGAVFRRSLEPHSERLHAHGEPESWSLDLTFERERHPNG
ncbi:hypothetical protein [Agrococcus lahaulensis]|uniref:hypothetical protein n=1 Tax=Agrococcus lahaulensis TaxID=341722 RepID=UPI00047CE389|nr:hypothetical protein [Agrococcus lahaulensis]